MAAFEFGNYPDRPGRPGFGMPPAQNATAAPAQTPAFGANEHTATPSHGRPPVPPVPPKPDPPAVISEPVLAFKIYDSCRHKDCLTVDDIGNARHVDSDELIVAPEGARSVHIENLRVRRIVIADKEANPLMAGYWDMEIHYVFNYDLRFSGESNTPLNVVEAQSTFTRRCSLFGSYGTQITVATDIFGQMDIAMDGEPFVMVEAKAVSLGATIARRNHGRDEVRHHGDGGSSQGGGHHPRRDYVNVTIGLFSIIKLYRLVSLQVESRGFVIPPPCGDICTPDPCELFEDQPFPLDSFAPLQKPEFTGINGINGGISNTAITSDEAE